MVKWIPAVYFFIMNRIFAVPKTKEGMTVRGQQMELAKNCAEFFARKLVDLKSHAKSLSAVADVDLVGHLRACPGIGEIPDQDNGIGMVNQIREHLQNSLPEDGSAVAGAKPKLIPMAAQLDASGRVSSDYVTRAVGAQAVEAIRWDLWVEQVESQQSVASLCKSFLMAAVKELWEATHKPPITMARTKGKIMCKTWSC